MFEGEAVLVEHDGVEISATALGDGPPVLLLHGYPQSRAMWHRVAPRLADRHTVIAADLRGYGDSGKPAGEVYSKREMAADQLHLMSALGFERFAVVGHDRGGRVAHRMSLDAPERVQAIAVLDIVPTLHMFDHVDRAMATSYFHWFFLAQPNSLPEQLIAAAPDAWLASRFAGRYVDEYPIAPTAYEHYRRVFRDPATIAATCADYRAAASIDLDHDRADLDEGRVVEAPLLALWGEESYVGRHFDVPAVWREVARDVRGHGVRADHYLAEEAPDDTAQALLDFLAEQAPAGRS